MDKYTYLIKRKFFFAFIFILIFQNLKCNSDDMYNDFQNYCKSKTLDRLRQIYWNIKTDPKKNHRRYPLGDEDSNENLHLLDRKQIMGHLYQYFIEINATYDKDFNKFINNITEKFSNTNLDYLFSTNMSRHFLINFAINIDKYERIHENKIDGIFDYINYLKNNQIIEYLNNKASKYNFINNQTKFNEIVLNNIDISDYNNIENFYTNKSIEELTDCIYGIKNYYYNVENISNNEVDFYEKEEELKHDEKGLKTLMSLYTISLKDHLKNVDDYMYKIHLRNFKYINNTDFLNRNEDELAENIFILEKYYKRQEEKNQSLRELEKYVKEMPYEKKQKALDWGLLLYPELYIDDMFQDISTSEINLQYGKVRSFIDGIERSLLLKYAYNIHTYNNKIYSIYDEKIFNLYRYKNEKLNQIILSDTNSDRDLQLKNNFDKEANLRQDNFNEYLKKLPRNQLKKILNAINSLYYREISYVEDYKKPSEELINQKEFEFLDIDKLFDLTQTKYISCLPKDSKTSKFMNKSEQYLKNFTFEGYYSNIIDFLRSTNIIYLKLWLKKFEDFFRIKFSLKGVKGGFKYSYFNDYDKEELLKIYDIYLTKFEEYFTPKEFIKIVGLDKGITPHKYLIDLFYSNRTDKAKEIKRILYSLNAYYQRKNLQIYFDFQNLIDSLYISLNNSNSNYENYLFQFFRIINIFPELNYEELFKIICVYNETRVLYLNNNTFLDLTFKQKSINKAREYAENIQYFLKHTNYTKQIEDNKTISDMDEKELRDYINKFINYSSGYEDIELKSKVIDGYFEYCMYDYFESHLKKADENRINYIFKNVKDFCKNYPCKNISLNDKIYFIKENIQAVQEFQDPLFFDKNFDNLDDIKNNSLSIFLKNSTIKDLKYYTILVVILKLESNKKNNESYLYDDLREIDLHIFTMSRNEMIKYILNESEIFNTNEKNENKTIEEMLPILTKYYMLDLGSENIYDLILY